MVHFPGRSRRARACLLSLVAAIVLVASSPAFAQVGTPQPPQSMVGFQGGASIDPEQVFVGVHWQSPPIAQRFHIRPGIDGGFGQGLRMATINIDFIVRFPLGGSGWNFVQGAGPMIVLTKFEDFDGSSTSAGASYIIGFGHDSGFLGEFRIGSGTEPALKMGAGWGIRF